MNRCDPDKHLCPPTLFLFISVLGELNYLGQTSRPDILYALYSCYENNKTQCQWGSVELALHRGQIHLHMPGIANRLDNAPNRNPINKTKVFWWDGFLSRTVGKSSNSVWWEATSVVAYKFYSFIPRVCTSCFVSSLDQDRIQAWKLRQDLRYLAEAWQPYELARMPEPRCRWYSDFQEQQLSLVRGNLCCGIMYSPPWVCISCFIPSLDCGRIFDIRWRKLLCCQVSIIRTWYSPRVIQTAMPSFPKSMIGSLSGQQVWSLSIFSRWPGRTIS